MDRAVDFRRSAVLVMDLPSGILRVIQLLRDIGTRGCFAAKQGCGGPS
jgi:hypothetical protein